MGKIFAVTSGKGGVGKSTFSVGLSLALSKSEKSVLLIDMDEGLRCLDIMLGVDKSTVFDLSDILGGKEISDAVYEIPNYENLFLIPAPAKLGLIDAFTFTTFAQQVKTMFDVVIFDFPAGIDFSLYTCLPQDSLCLTVALPDPVSVRDASVVSQMLSQIGCSARLIINCFEYKLAKKHIFKNIDEIIDQSELQLLGIIPKSSELALLSVKHKLKPKGKVMRAFTRIAKRLLGENILLPNIKKI